MPWYLYRGKKFSDYLFGEHKQPPVPDDFVGGLPAKAFHEISKIRLKPGEAVEIERIVFVTSEGGAHDSQIDDLRVVRGAVKRPGGLLVTIWPMGEGAAHG